LDLAAEHVAMVLSLVGAATVVDLGAGDGGLLSILPETVNRWGYDLQRSNVEAAKARGVDVRYADVLRDPIDWAEVAVATEMVEHLVDPVGFLQLVWGHCGAVVLSSPRTETPEQHYEHHLWAWDGHGYREMVRRAGWVVERHDDVGMFQVLTAVHA
jgi:2-polyprenyl-3-methyl-5-hydroxy-6-metoxy-1,4-benzoquinol methylase